MRNSLTKVRDNSWTAVNYPIELAVEFNLKEVLGESLSQLGVKQERGISLNYGGTQFGFYSDLGDKRSAVVEDNGQDGVLIVKGGFRSPLCNIGDGRYVTALKEQRVSQQLEDLGIKTQKVINTLKTANSYSSLIWRPTSFRLGTLEYAQRHCPHTVRQVWNLVKRHAGDVDMSDKDLLLYIKDGYRKLVKDWDEVGFVHGCLNTDNICLLPCGIDYGHSYFECIEEHDLKFDPNRVYSAQYQEEIIKTALQQLEQLLKEHNIDI